MGLTAESDQRPAMAFFRTHSEPLLAPCRYQAQAHDHVLGDEERKQGSFAAHCATYRKTSARGSCRTGERWPFAGIVVPGYLKLDRHDNEFWEIFWKLYHQLVIPMRVRSVCCLAGVTKVGRLERPHQIRSMVIEEGF
jgi:hypothetical protein